MPGNGLVDHSYLIERLLRARRSHNYGDQHDYFDHPRCVGWVRTGDVEHPGVLAVVLSNGDRGTKWMHCFRPHARFRDITGHISEEVVANAHGWAEFYCPAGNVSVWLT